MNRLRNWVLATWAVKASRDLVPFSTNLQDFDPYVTLSQCFLLANVRVKTGYRKIFDPDFFATHRISISPLYNFNPTGEEKDVNIELNGKTYSLENVINEIIETEKQRPQQIFNLEFMENLAKNSIKFRVGNCSELTAICCLLLMECDARNTDNTPIRITRVKLENFDHVFNIIGLAVNADLSIPETWGSEAIIADPLVSQLYHVESQLLLSVEERIPLFQKILENLSIDEIIFTEWEVGAGHSRKWNEKNRPPLKFSSRFFTSQIPTEFPNTENNSDKKGLGYIS